MLQQWEGRVIAISKDTFVAIISDRTNPENPQEKVEIELSEISQDDIGLIRPGSFFIGLSDTRMRPVFLGNVSPESAFDVFLAGLLKKLSELSRKH